MIILLGGSGYVGGAFQAYFRSRDIDFKSISRKDFDYYEAAALAQLLKNEKADFLINAAGYTGKPNVDACEIYKTDSILGNVVLPGRIREACETADIPWGHVSSGCIYSGRRDDGKGFTEEDVPNFSFRKNNCSFYSGTKALGEEVLAGAENCYIWRLRIPFNNEVSARNYLQKMMTYDRLLEAENSISHLEDFVSACFQAWEKRISFGIYNITNPGPVTTREVVAMIGEERERRESAGEAHSFPDNFSFFEDEVEFMKIAAKTPRSNCVMDSSKLDEAGISLRSAKVAIADSLKHWGETLSVPEGH